MPSRSRGAAFPVDPSGNKDAPYAYYLVALCYYERISDVTRDQKDTQQALQALNEVIRRYPATTYATDAKVKLDLVNDHLAGKEMEVGRFYERSGKWLAGTMRFRAVVDKYQQTSHTPEALYRLVECFSLGIPEEAQKAAAVLGNNYPGNEWYERAFKLMNSKVLASRQLTGFPPPGRFGMTTGRGVRARSGGDGRPLHATGERFGDGRLELVGGTIPGIAGAVNGSAETIAAQGAPDCRAEILIECAHLHRQIGEGAAPALPHDVEGARNRIGRHRQPAGQCLDHDQPKHRSGSERRRRRPKHRHAPVLLARERAERRLADISPATRRDPPVADDHLGSRNVRVEKGGQVLRPRRDRH
jgi:hypothetical protein